MVEKFCLFLTNRMRKENPEIDDERAEIINYGLQLLVGEIPKMLITIGIAYLLGILKLTVIMVILILPFRAFSGGFHLHTHIGCILSTTLFYCGIAKISNYIYLHSLKKVIFVLCVWIFGIIIISLYAPADTENVPILRKKERKQKKILSYIIFTLGLILSLVIKNNAVCNIIIFGYLVQTLMITPVAYKITKNSYGYKKTSTTLA
ncbi:MAG: accessory gene regulator B family protein [Clostridia bacterium]|nr:accessory gene regulator B family protein [Clostridia bacterium]